ncbi:RES family NAD+ phosphorylase [Chitinophaga pinensis]|uniref:RES domain-containing protein n=1 Tax=Chitinophaga pinensis (strain ATCC 43595 / DSM 2588 / LMG 13176 / NBRC 15968 / NCIMB 11800 / UQM 2034) TaxID=485918 RepID=A0A979G5B1_CHIPD|nr:RES family NAD+ phosphorylase [Chitinophaga pinensis]ACU60970.1 hypothetical protein Cpin_3506 [Chitinophaga pinensis DSM 2588]
MSDYKTAIDRLQKLDLSTYPYNEIKDLIQLFGKFGIIQMTLHKGKVLIRARPNTDGQPSFTKRSELSYTPSAFNKKYQRASTPNQTMFYAGTIPEGIAPDELNNARIIASLETSHLLRNAGHEGEQRVTFSKWVVTHDIPLVAVCYNKDFVTKSSHTKELYDSYQNSVAGLDDYLRDKSLAISEFLASEFAKTDVDPDYKYMISAIFGETVANTNHAGVYFPSVRADAKGYNVAINPEFADNCLQLVAAGECTIYKKGENTIVDNETVCTITDDSIPFELLPIDAQYRVGRDSILKELNTKTK